MTEWIMIVGEFGSYNRFSSYFFVNCIDWLRTQTSPKSSRSQICCMYIGHAVLYINNNLHILLCALNSERLNFEFSWLALHALRYWYDLMRGKINWNSTRVKWSAKKGTLYHQVAWVSGVSVREGGGNKGPLKCFLLSGLSLEGSYVSHNFVIVAITASLSDYNKLNKSEQSSDPKK